MDHDAIRDLISVLGFVISLFLLFVHIKNRHTQLSSYQLARATYRSSSIDLHYIGSEQVDDHVLLKLVLFNPGSVAAIIQSFAVFEVSPTRNSIRRLFWPTEWRRIEDARWWPTKNADQKTSGYLADEYENLYVEDFRTILVSIPGMIDRREYLFEVRTNHGSQTTRTTIAATASHFSHHFERWYRER